MSYSIDWVVKASKLCNLRCSYCYEWDELADPERMPLELWEKVLVAVRDHLGDALSWDFHGGLAQANIIWHGGEPLLLPRTYFQDVLDLQDKIFPAVWREAGLVRNTMQTNLYKAPDATLSLLREQGFSFGVSYDGVSGVRMTAAGKVTEPQVLNNIARARAMGFDPGAIVVVAGHTAPRLRALYEELRGAVSQMKLLPLFNGPDTRPVAGVSIGAADIVEALADLFRFWLDDGCAVRIDPLERYFSAVLNARLGLSARPYDRRRFGDNVMIVNIDGALRTPGASYDSPAFGDLASQSIEEILASEPYAATLEAEDRARAATCGRCPYHGGCNSYPLFASDDGAADGQDCMIARPLMEAMDRHLDRLGVNDDELARLFEDASGMRAAA